MRLAQVGLGSGVGLSGFDRKRPTPGQVRVLFFLRQKCQTTTATVIPGETHYDTFDKKTPLRQPTREE